MAKYLSIIGSDDAYKHLIHVHTVFEFNVNTCAMYTKTKLPDFFSDEIEYIDVWAIEVNRLCKKYPETYMQEISRMIIYCISSYEIDDVLECHRTKNIECIGWVDSKYKRIMDKVVGDYC